MYSFFGPNRAIWRHSSEPIDPPAPVTRTRRPAIWSAIAARSSDTGRRPRRSLRFRSRRSVVLTWPFMMSQSGGSTSTDSPACSARSDSSRIRGDSACGSATTLVIALPQAESPLIRELSDLAEQAGLSVLVLPPLWDIMNGQVSTTDLRDLNLSDLLGRRPVSLD